MHTKKGRKNIVICKYIPCISPKNLVSPKKTLYLPKKNLYLPKKTLYLPKKPCISQKKTMQARKLQRTDPHLLAGKTALPAECYYAKSSQCAPGNLKFGRREGKYISSRVHCYVLRPVIRNKWHIPEMFIGSFEKKKRIKFIHEFRGELCSISTCHSCNYCMSIIPN